MVKKFAPLALALALLAGAPLEAPEDCRVSNTTPAVIRTIRHGDGVVTSSWGVPLVPFKLYKVDDGTGEVTVVSQDGRVADARARASACKGRVNEFATFGGQSRRPAPAQEHLVQGILRIWIGIWELRSLRFPDQIPITR
jgi:hypothetical protein